MIRKAIVYILISLNILPAVFGVGAQQALAALTSLPAPGGTCYTAGSGTATVNYCLLITATAFDNTGRLTLFLKDDSSKGIAFDRNALGDPVSSHSYSTMGGTTSKTFNPTSSSPIHSYAASATNAWQYISSSSHVNIDSSRGILLYVQNSKIIGVFAPDKTTSSKALFADWKPTTKTGAASVSSALSDLAIEVNKSSGAASVAKGETPDSNLLAVMDQLTSTTERQEMAKPYWEKLFKADTGEKYKWTIKVNNNGDSPPSIIVPASDKTAIKRPSTEWVLDRAVTARGKLNVEANYLYFKLTVIPSTTSDAKNILTAFQKHVYLRTQERRGSDAVTLIPGWVIDGPDDCNFENDEGFEGVEAAPLIWREQCQDPDPKVPFYCGYEKAVFKYVYNTNEDGKLNNPDTNADVRKLLSMNGKPSGTQVPNVKFINLDQMLTGPDANSNPDGYLKKWVGEKRVCRNQDNLLGGNQIMEGGGLDNKCNCGEIKGNWIFKILQQGMCALLCWLYDIAVSLQQNATCYFNMSMGTLQDSSGYSSASCAEPQ